MINTKSHFKSLDEIYARAFGSYDSKPDENKNNILENINKGLIKRFTKEADIEGLGTIHYIEKPFDVAINYLKHNNYEMISARDLAYARIKTGVNHSLMNEGSYVKEGSLYVPNSDTRRILVRNSLVLDQNLSEVVNANKNNEEFYLSIDSVQSLIDIAKKQDVTADAFLIKNRKSIPTNRFGEDERTVWLFGDVASEYGQFLKEECGIAEMPLYLYNMDSGIDQQEQPFISQLWLGSRDDCSRVIGNNRILDYVSRVRGVARDKIFAEGDAIKIVTKK